MSNFNYVELIKVLFRNKTFSGGLSIPQDMINRDFKNIILNKFGNSIKDYKITFDSGYIFLQVLGEVGPVGKLQGNYKFRIDDFTFKNGQHKIKLSYSEDVRSKGNVMQSMALKAAGVNGSYLKTAYEFALKKQSPSKASDFLSAIKVSNNAILINLDAIDGFQKMFDDLELTYKSSENGFLKFQI